MKTVSYSDLFGIRHVRDYDEHIQEGDMVRSGPNSGPYFVVLAVKGEKAWVRNPQNGTDGIVDLNRCRKVNGAPPASPSSEGERVLAA